MSDKKTSIEKIKPFIEKIKTKMSWDKSNGISFKVEYCNSKDKSWHFAQKDTDPTSLVKTCKGIISKMNADAIRLSLYTNNKLSESEIVRITNARIPFLRDSEVIEEKPNKESTTQIHERIDELESGLNGQAGSYYFQGLQRENENKLKLQQIEYENKLQRLNDKIELLNEKIINKNSYIGQLERDYELHEAEIKKLQEEVSVKKLNSGKRTDLLLAAGLGKFFDMKNEEIIGLAGILTGNDLPSKSSTGKEELLDPENEETANSGRADDIKTISKWLYEIDDNKYQHVCFIIKALAKNPSMYLETMKFMEEKTGEKQQPVKEEKTEEKKEEKVETLANEENKEPETNID